MALAARKKRLGNVDRQSKEETKYDNSPQISKHELLNNNYRVKC